MTTEYRNGAIGAMMDEYERAANELKDIMARIPQDEFGRILDPSTEDEDCRSVQTIISHVINAGYSYADYIRGIYSMASNRQPRMLVSYPEYLRHLDMMLSYTVQTLEGRWELTQNELMNVRIASRWGVQYDFEQLLEHAIVHILRHRRQLEKFVASGMVKTRA